MSKRTAPSDRSALLGRALNVFEQVVELVRDERMARLEALCGDEAELRAAVEELLAHHEATRFRTAGLLAKVEGAPSPGSGLAGARLGAYRLERRAGMGGMGVVYRAQQDDPRRVVALKVVRVDAVSDELLQRFRREVQLLAQLQHPGIAQVYDSGTFATEWGALPYFAMEFVEGRPIDELVRERRLDARAICALIIDICEAVQHAHERGVLHRDLKPSNLFVVELGNGRLQPKVLDFGIARSLAEDAAAPAQTVTGQLLGTLGYMSPERTAGEARADHRADVYSLGVVLYELLSGRPPFDLDGRSLGEVARILQHDEPTRLGAHVSRFRGDLETIVAKALAREPDRRYPSAAAFADDLRRYLDHRPIHARPLSAWYFLRKSILRHRAVFGGLAATLLVLVVGLVVALTLAGRNEELANSERAAREKAVAARNDLRATLYRAEMRLVSQAQRDPRGIERARRTLAHWLPDPGAAEVDLRGVEWFLANGLMHPEALVTEAPRDTFLAWLPSGIVYAAPEHWVTLDPRTGEKSRRPRVPGATNSLRLTASREHYVTGTRGGFRVARTADDEVLVEERLAVVNDARISPDGRYVAVTAMPDRDTLSIYDVQERRYLQQDLPRVLGPRSFEFSHTGALFASAQAPGELRVRAAPRFDEPRRIELPPDRPHAMAWSPDDSQLAIGYRNGPIDVVDVASGLRVRRLIGHDGCVTELRWRADGSELLSSCSDSTVRVWNLATGVGRVLGGHDGDARRVAWSPDERQVVSVGYDGRLRIFEVEPEQVVRRVLPDDAPPPRGLVWSRDGSQLVVDHDHETVFVVPETREVVRRLPGRGVRCSASGRFCSRAIDGCLEVRDVRTGELLASVAGWGGSPCRWHPRDDRLAVAHAADGVFEWRPGRPQLERLHDLRQVHVFAWHPDGESLIGAAGSVQCFRLQPGPDGWQRSGHLHPGNSRLWAPSPDGARYVIQYASREFHVVEQASGDVPMTLHGASDDGHDIAWSPDGRRIATVGRGGALRLWDAETGLELFVLRLAGETTSVAWHPAGDRLAVVAGGRALLIDARDGGGTPR